MSDPVMREKDIHLLIVERRTALGDGRDRRWLLWLTGLGLVIVVGAIVGGVVYFYGGG